MVWEVNQEILKNCFQGIYSLSQVSLKQEKQTRFQIQD